MKVDPNGVSLNLNSTELTKSAPSQADEISTPAGDKTTLSPDTSSVSELAQKALATPEVRQDKVEALRQAIQSGDYKIEPDKIAQALIDKSN